MPEPLASEARFYLAMASRWNFERLRDARTAQPLLARLTCLVNAMVRNPVLQTGLQQVLGFTRSEFKQHSLRGCVWMDRRLVDIGNYRYAVIYQFLWRFARHMHMHALTELFDSLSAMYSSLQLKAEFTYRSGLAVVRDGKR